MFSIKIEDDLELGFYTEKTAEEVFRVVMESYDFLYPWAAWLDENYSLERSKEFVEFSLKQFGNREMTALRIVYRGATAGGIGLNKFDWHSKTTEIGYWLAEKYTGKGLATKSCRKLIDYAFDELELNRVVIKCIKENIKSRAVPERLNFTPEGIEREGGRHRGKFVDLVVYSMLAKDWKNRSEAEVSNAD